MSRAVHRHARGRNAERIVARDPRSVAEAFAGPRWGTTVVQAIPVPDTLAPAIRVIVSGRAVEQNGEDIPMSSTRRIGTVFMTLGMAAAILGGFWLGTRWTEPVPPGDSVSPMAQGIKPEQLGEKRLSELPDLCRSWLSAARDGSGFLGRVGDSGQFGGGPVGSGGAEVRACKYRLDIGVLSVTRRRQISGEKASSDFGEAYKQFREKFGSSVEFENGEPFRRIWVPASSMAVTLRGRDSFIAALTPPDPGVSKDDMFALLDRIADAPVSE